MLHDEHTLALGRALAEFGLDLNRYTEAHARGFLARWPSPADWASSEARSLLISTFGIGETTFMRHPEHFEAVRALMPELLERRGGAPLRAWSAGCASGEEAYSLAATLARAGRSSFELFAWDVNQAAVARALEGEYRPWSLRDVDAQRTEGWLEPAPCGVRVEAWLRQLLRFQVGNLHQDTYPADLDIVFCRNVLLYFERHAAARVLARIAENLRPGGVLFLGHYDPQPGADTGLVLEQLGKALFYRKPTRASHLVLPEPMVSLVERQSLIPRALPAAPGSEYGIRNSAESRMELVRLLANQRRTEQALELLSELGSSTPLKPELHVLTALVAEDAGDMRLMLEASRRACFLLPDQPGPNYFLSVAFVRNGELRRAAVHRRIAAAALRKSERLSSVVEYSEGLTVGQLRRLIGAVGR